MNELTKRLYAAGWTREHHPDYVYWSDWQNLGYKFEYACKLVWKTPCGLFVEGRSVVSANASYMGVDYCPENGNPLRYCPHDRKDCKFIPDGLRGKFAWCPCHLVEGPYDYDHSAEKIENEFSQRRHKQYMEITGGQYCACVVDSNGYNGGLLEVRYDVDQCIRCRCRNEFCSIRKQARDLKKVNIFYDVRRTFITREGMFEETRTEITKGNKVFPHPVARTDAEIWLATKKAEFDPIRDKHIIEPHLTMEDRRMAYFSKHHRQWPGYDYFEFRYEVENIRIEARESRDLLQDLRDVADGLTVFHASDQKAAAKQKKRDAKDARAEAKARKKRRNLIEDYRAKGDDPKWERLFRSQLGNETVERLIAEREAAKAGIGDQFSMFEPPRCGK